MIAQNENHKAPSPETITEEMVEAARSRAQVFIKAGRSSQLYNILSGKDLNVLALTAALPLPRKDDDTWKSGSNDEAQVGMSAQSVVGGQSREAPTAGDGSPQSSGRSNDGPDWQAMYEELKSTHIEKVEAIRAEYMAMTFNTIEANSRKDGAVCATCREACAKVADKHCSLFCECSIASRIRSLAGETPGPLLDDLRGLVIKFTHQRHTSQENEVLQEIVARVCRGEPAPASPVPIAEAYWRKRLSLAKAEIQRLRADLATYAKHES